MTTLDMKRTEQGLSCMERDPGCMEQDPGCMERDPGCTEQSYTGEDLSSDMELKVGVVQQVEVLADRQ